MKKIRLTSICSPKQWRTIPTKDLLDEGYPVYGANGVIGYCKEYNHTSDTIIIGCRGSCGNVNIARGKSYINGNAMCLDDLSSDVDILYLYYFLQNYDFRSVISGTTIPQVTKQGLEKIDVVVSSKENQREIVRQLQLLDSIIEERHKELRYFDALIKSRFIEMFGNEIYPVTPLINLIKEGAGLSYGIVQPGNDGTGDMGILRPVDMVEGKISAASIKYISRDIGDSFKKTELTGDELLITVRGTTGITALTDGRFVGMNVTRGIAVIRYDRRKINPIYLKTYLNTDKSQRYIQEHTRGATLQQINLSDLRIQEIPAPPMTRQEKMAAFVEQVDKSKFYIIQMQILLRLLIRAIQQKTTEVLL